MTFLRYWELCQEGGLAPQVVADALLTTQTKLWAAAAFKAFWVIVTFFGLHGNGLSMMSQPAHTCNLHAALLQGHAASLRNCNQLITVPESRMHDLATTQHAA